jgi:hypothetical protein
LAGVWLGDPCDALAVGVIFCGAAPTSDFGVGVGVGVAPSGLAKKLNNERCLFI